MTQTPWSTQSGLSGRTLGKKTDGTVNALLVLAVFVSLGCNVPKVVESEVPLLIRTSPLKDAVVPVIPPITERA